MADPSGSRYLGVAGKLPENLVRCSIEITTRRRETCVATVLEVIECRDDFILVLDSGMPS